MKAERKPYAADRLQEAITFMEATYLKVEAAKPGEPIQVDAQQMANFLAWFEEERRNNSAMRMQLLHRPRPGVPRRAIG